MTVLPILLALLAAVAVNARVLQKRQVFLNYGSPFTMPLTYTYSYPYTYYQQPLVTYKLQPAKIETVTLKPIEIPIYQIRFETIPPAGSMETKATSPPTEPPTTTEAATTTEEATTYHPHPDHTHPDPYHPDPYHPDPYHPDPSQPDPYYQWPSTSVEVTRDMGTLRSVLRRGGKRPIYFRLADGSIVAAGGGGGGGFQPSGNRISVIQTR